MHHYRLARNDYMLRSRYKETSAMQTILAKAPTAARILLGLIFFVFGLNGFLGFLPQPEVSGEGGAFLGALAATGYMFPLIKGVETLAGALLLGNRLVPLALLLLAPIIVNIVAFHVLLSPGGFGMLAIIVGLGGYLARHHWESFAPLFRGPSTTSAQHTRDRAPRHARAV